MFSRASAFNIGHFSNRINRFYFPLLYSHNVFYHAPFHSTSNILLMGPPGSGKTSIGKLLSNSLNIPVYDIDDDHLEKYCWKQTVASKLLECGDEKFLEEESVATMLITPETHSNYIISLTGSNPLNLSAMNHLKQNGICIYLDCDQNEIINRCHLMKINRIVGQNTLSLNDILNYRHNIYENCYDIRIIIELNESLESITNKIINVLNNEISSNKKQLFVSTRSNPNNPDDNDNDSLTSIILNGLSVSDGGLYFPLNFNESIHKFNISELNRLTSINNYASFALRILEIFPLDKHLSSSKLKQFLNESYQASSFSNCDDIIPLKRLDSTQNIYLMELFHGNTASFKDIALQLFPKLYLNAFNSVYNNDNNDNDISPLFIVATSGDTGSSVLNGFNLENRNIPIIILYPLNGVSFIQEKQIQQYALQNPNNIFILAIKNSDFDFCQNCVKYIFENKIFEENKYKNQKYKLASANSINWVRLLPQIPFYFWSYKQLNNPSKFDVCIPTGNFGHILSAIIAKRCGLPIRKLICATNDNCILYDFINNNDGEFNNINRTLNKTISPSIDILLPSNLERYLYLISSQNEKNNKFISKLMNDYRNNKYFRISSDQKNEIFNDELIVGKTSDNECKKMIKHVYNKYNYLIDPHTSTAMNVAQQYYNNNENIPMVVASTAHYSKFPETILNALTMESETVTDHSEYNNNLKYDKLFDILENDFKSENKIHPNIKKLINQIKKIDENDNNKFINVSEPIMDDIIQKIDSFLQKRDSVKYHETKQNNN